MDAERVQKLIGILTELETQLQKFPQLAERFTGALNSARGALEAISSRDFIASTTQLNQEFNRLFETFESGSRRGSEGLASMLSRMEQLREVTGSINAISQRNVSPTARNAPSYVPPVKTENQRLAEEFRQLGAEADAAFTIATNRAADSSAAVQGAEQATRELTDATREYSAAVSELQGLPRPPLEEAVRAATQQARVADEGPPREAIDAQALYNQRVAQFSETLKIGQKDAEAMADQMRGLGQDVDITTRVWTDLNSGVTRFKTVARPIVEQIDATGDVTRKLGNEMTFLEGRINSAGKVITESTGRFRSFGDTVLRNIGEVAKWSIAVGAVYGTIQKGQQLIEQAIENQTKLAEIQVVLRDSQRDLNSIFREALTIARETGSSVEGVLDSYTDAIRVTARIENETERFITANQLLTDSLVLAKLGTIEQSEAMDLLIGSLQQGNKDLSTGSDLLDKWVATTNVAGVTLEDLATAFSITAGAAEIAGIQVGGVDDQLSALIATIAEEFPYGGRELGNRIRGLISGFGDPQRQEVLFDLGISPTDIEGQVRPFFDILEEISTKFREGLISEQDLGKIAGGNVRQRNILIAAIQNLSEVQDINAKTADSEGAAQKALGIQLETVKTAVDRLGNAMASLGNTLGTEGGVLESITKILNLLTSLVEVVDKLISLTGRAGPALALLLGANAIYARGFNVQGGFIGGIAASATGRLGGKPGEGGLLTSAGIQASALKFSNAVGNILPGILATGISTALFDQERNLTTLGLSLSGAIVGGLVAGPVGSIIGSQMASGFAAAFISNESVEFSNNLSDVIAIALRESLDDASPAVPDEELTERELLDQELNQILQENTTQWGRTLNEFAINFGKIVNESVVGPLLEVFGVDTNLPNLPHDAALQGGLINLAQIGGNLSPEELNRIQEIGARQVELEQAAIDAKVAQDEYNTSLSNINTDALQEHSQALEQVRQQINTAFAEGTISSQEYFDELDRLSEIPLQIADAFQIWGDDIVSQVDDVNTLDEAWNELFDLILKADPLVGRRIQELATVDTADIEALTRATDEFFNLLENTPRDDPFRVEYKLPSVVDLSDLEGPDQLTQILSEMEYLVEQYAQTIAQIFGITYEQALNYLDELREDIVVRAGSDLRVLENIYQPFFDTARQTVTGKGARTNFGFQEIDLPSSAYGQIQQAINYFATELGKLGYVQNKQPTAIKFADDVIQVKDVDSQLLQLALNELIDVNRDQLEGIYNLPTDASFFVPFTGYQLGFGQDGGGGLGNLPTVDLAGSDVFSSATGLFSSAVDLFSQAVQEDKQKALGAEKARMLEEIDFSIGKESKSTKGGKVSPYPTYDVQAIQSLREFQKIKGDSFKDGRVSEQLSQINQSILNAINIRKVDKIAPVELRLQLQSISQLTLDGRIIAQVVKRHLAQDLIQFQGSGGGATISYVV